MAQNIMYADGGYRVLDRFFKQNSVKKIFLVCDGSMKFLQIASYFDELEKNIPVVRFSDFQPNPLFESVVKGVKLYQSEGCGAIVAVGGGSALDVAKCIKLYSDSEGEDFLAQTPVPNHIPFLAVPTTAGTGSEATRYAVVYLNGVKQTVTDESCIPTDVLFDASALKTLPDYQKKATMMDAFCHAVESFWSVNSTDESKRFAKEAIRIILLRYRAYLSGEDGACREMLKASNLAGKAINISQTTAGHAMCYKLTSLYGIAHGHAAALCVSKLWKYMVDNTDRCIDARGRAYLDGVFSELAEVFSLSNPAEGARFFEEFVRALGLEAPRVGNESDYAELKKSVNPVRLKNNPVRLDEVVIDRLYHAILERE